MIGDTCAPGNPAGRDSVCNGLDDDCDGSVDEAFIPKPTSCGVGVCAASGTTVCVAGVVSDSCAPGSPTSGDADCDGIDGDCDGATDESFVGTPTSCGTGVCASTGTTICTAGVIGDSCTAGTPNGRDSQCDGKDNDCDGATDEAFVDQPTTCGVGACAGSGLKTCENGVVLDSCVPGQPGTVDVCDGNDNDCDGTTDEDFVPEVTSCGTAVCAAMGATTCVNGIVGDSCVPGTPGLGDPFCDGVDEDCDGQTDEDFGGLGIGTTCGVGVCASEGIISCVNGQVIDTCTPGPVSGDDSDCDLVDNDCDSATDESFVNQPTTCGVGACAGSGATSCNNGVVSDSCTPGGPTGDDADCNGVDDDCDGSTDESFVSGPTSCGVGVCASTGMTTCTAGVVGDTCKAGRPTGGDANCDGADNDCDGSTDESFVSEETNCGQGVCAARGLTLCTDGQVTDTCAPGGPIGADDNCDSIDDDCDGSTDESFVGVFLPCGVGVCQNTSQVVCIDGTTIDTCVPGLPTGGDADCDGTDNDCDGSTDESFVGEPTSCGTGVCASTGTTSCTAGVIVDTCNSGAPTGGDADCDGADNDCDGSTDESFVSSPTSCGTGACASTGATTCTGGVVGDTCTSGAPTGNDADCDGADNDCDGSTDESFVAEPTSCGTGVCASAGTTTCTAGVIGDSCAPGNPTPGGDATCNGQDDDCDGSTDESFVGVETNCGLGVCANRGITVCVAGVQSDTCTPGAPIGTDSNCDSVDDDCDGSTDESFVGEFLPCGSGACATTSQVVCVDGATVDTCGPVQPTGTDDNCNGVDDDCDGSTDESFVSESTSCGEGECHARGITYCSGGTVYDSCEPGVGRPDANCDGADNDCDGSIDEDFVGEKTSCGEGACHARGVTYCADGAIYDSCVPAGPSRPDSNCNGIDDDCDGDTDEAFRSEPTICGEGECYNRGMTACVAGAVVDTCEPKAPTDEICEDGIDQDCDGQPDNGCECPAPGPGLVYAVASAHSDECHGGTDMHSISLPGFFTGVGEDEALFSFNDDALFEWSDDGFTARVAGSATLTSAGGEGAAEVGSVWWVEVIVNYRGSGVVGEGSGGPVLALEPACQPASLTQAWEYFDMFDGDAIISRIDDPSDYALFTMFPAGGVFPMQMGYAANNKNAAMGLSAGLEFIHYKSNGCATRNTGAISVDLECP
ncbi:MAG: MopE-related protein [Myxococcota bacterium]